MPKLNRFCCRLSIPFNPFFKDWCYISHLPFFSRKNNIVTSVNSSATDGGRILSWVYIGLVVKFTEVQFQCIFTFLSPFPFED